MTATINITANTTTIIMTEWLIDLVFSDGLSGLSVVLSVVTSYGGGEVKKDSSAKQWLCH